MQRRQQYFCPMCLRPSKTYLYFDITAGEFGFCTDVLCLQNAHKRGFVSYEDMINAAPKMTTTTTKKKKKKKQEKRCEYCLAISKQTWCSDSCHSAACLAKGAFDGPEDTPLPKGPFEAVFSPMEEEEEEMKDEEEAAVEEEQQEREEEEEQDNKGGGEEEKSKAHFFDVWKASVPSQRTSKDK